MSRRSIVNACVLTLLLQATATPRLNAQESSGSHLKGVTAIAVHVNLNGDPNVSLPPTQLETALEQRLRQAGISVGHMALRAIFGQTCSLLGVRVTVSPF